MSTILGLTIFTFALVGFVRVMRVTFRASRRGLAAMGRALARLEKPNSPASDPIAEIVSLAQARASRARKVAS